MKVKVHNHLWAEALKKPTLEHAELLGVSFDSLKLYHQFVSDHYESALKKMFSRLNFFCELNWEEVAKKFLVYKKASAWDLNDFCLGFNHFFRAEYALLPEYLHELVDYELSEFFIFKKLSHASTPVNTLYLNPVHELHIFEYKIAEWIVKAERLKNSKSKPKKEKNAFVIARNPNTHSPVFTSLNPLGMAIYNELSQQTYHTVENLTQVIRDKYELTNDQIPLLLETIQVLTSQSVILKNSKK